jgi:L1 cell adhesion molecule like protein
MGERAVASENRLIGTVSKSIPLAKKGELMIDVSLKVDENGNMNVKATESTLSKKSVSYSIDLNNGLNPEILEDVLEISNKFKEVDDFESNKLQLRADIDNFIYVLKDELKKFGKEVDSANSNSESSIKEESENAENLINPIINKIQLHSEDLEKLISEISFNTEEVLTKYQEIHNLLGELVNSNNTKKLEEEK